MEELLKRGKGQSVALLSKEISVTARSNILCTSSENAQQWPVGLDLCMCLLL